MLSVRHPLRHHQLSGKVRWSDLGFFACLESPPQSSCVCVLIVWALLVQNLQRLQLKALVEVWQQGRRPGSGKNSRHHSASRFPLRSAKRDPEGSDYLMAVVGCRAVGT